MNYKLEYLVDDNDFWLLKWDGTGWYRYMFAGSYAQEALQAIGDAINGDL